MPKNAPTTRYNGFLGLNNVDLLEEMERQDLVTAENVDLTNKNRLKRRRGYALSTSGDWHSLQTRDQFSVAVKDGDLIQLDENLNETSIRTGVGATAVDATVFANRLYWANGVQTGVWDGTTDSAWGLDLPNAPVLEAISGGMVAGTYKAQLTFMTATGEESGASQPTWITIADGQGIRVGLPSGVADATQIGVYLSHPDSDAVFLAKTVATGTLTVDLVTVTGLSRELQTRSVRPAPKGTIVEEHGGRLLVAQGSILYYTEPMAPGWFKESNYIQFASTITMLASVDGGLYVGADQTHYLAGEDLTQATMTMAGDSVPLNGTRTYLYPGDWPEITRRHVCWISDRGLVVAGPGGVLQHATEARYSFPVAERGTLQLVKKEGIISLLALMKEPADDSNAFGIGDRVTATVIRNGVVIG